jgi:hypothetical protein
LTTNFVNICQHESHFCSYSSKGQIKPKADWRALDSPKKTNKIIWGFFAMKSKKSKKKSFVHFLGESRARQSAYGFI